MEHIVGHLLSGSYLVIAYLTYLSSDHQLQELVELLDAGLCHQVEYVVVFSGLATFEELHGRLWREWPRLIESLQHHFLRAGMRVLAPTSAEHPLARPTDAVHCGRLLCSSGVEVISDQRLDFWSSRGPRFNGQEIRSLRPGRAARIIPRRGDDVVAAIAHELSVLGGEPRLTHRERDVVAMMQRRVATSSGVHAPPGHANIAVPHELLGMLIGNGGDIIKSVSKESGARIEIPPEESAAGELRVHLTGPAEATGKAKQLIENILSRPC